MPEEIKPVEDTKQEATTVKVGEKEYSQDDLNRLVGLGEMASEMESKWNTKYDKVYPEYTKATQTLKEREAEIEALKAQVAAKQEPANSEWNDESKAQIKKALTELFGDELLTKKEAEQLYTVREQAKSLIGDVNAVIESAKEDGKPATTPEDLLKHMEATGIKVPEKAYKDMFETELDKWKEEQIKKLKPSSFQTTSGSSAGAKEPAEVQVTNSNLRALLREKFNSQRRQKGQTLKNNVLNKNIWR